MHFNMLLRSVTTIESAGGRLTNGRKVLVLESLLMRSQFVSSISSFH